MTVLKTFLKLPKSPALIRAFSSEKQIQEVSIPVPWGEVRGKWWGPKDQRPILCLHGWQDNCGSFDRLLPLLSRNIGYLAVDFPGHGFASRIPVGCFYNITVFLLTVEYIRKYFNWPKLSLLGHSLGGATSLIYSFMYPDRVDMLTCMDIHLPLWPRHHVSLMSNIIQDFPRSNEFFVSKKEPPSYKISEIKKKMHAPLNESIQINHVKHLMNRNVAPSKIYPEKYYFTRDPRLKQCEMFCFTTAELMKNAPNIKCPVFLVRASSHGTHHENFYEILEVFKKNGIKYVFRFVKGTHHVHLNNPERFAEDLNTFLLENYNAQDRSLSNVKENIFVNEEDDVRIKTSFN
ncbi:probable serine hydrolase isoform X2 [Euwallacea fornicatus]|uniref:probable serine hydrolase isoform X2 n=1 Tax=Euwallacea fornicatus TaxID=995702 RepID=UPI00338D9A9D